ncbi:LPXTG cell wall anchor domain-containing protein, partial [Lacticaseibacillus rhamnosus]|uniref:LPXTG cell wall anchor domain-containing protein n=1 Tax=Lacticaseibacillus rhamnosus TaxID=47715 RepID=UPI0034677E57
TGTTAQTGKNNKQTAAAKTMQQGGEAQSPLAVLGLAILSMLGLAGFVSRKKRV